MERYPRCWEDFIQKNDLNRPKLNSKTGKLDIPKLEDAKNASIDSSRCTLILTEGDSVKSLVVVGLSSHGLQDDYGVYPLRGMMINAWQATPKHMQENEDFKNIINILGLMMFKEYENVESLRYRRVMIMANQDHDGSHMKGLVMALFHRYWPSLLKKIDGFLVELISLVIKATNKKKNMDVKSFYSLPEYEVWKDTNECIAAKYEIKYFRGLGTFDSEEAVEIFGKLDNNTKKFVWVDEEDDKALKGAFCTEEVQYRRDLIMAHKPKTGLDLSQETIRYQDFVLKELVLYFKDTVQRMIPSIVDGFKLGRRKIMFCAIKKKMFKPEEIVPFGGYVSMYSDYRHGEQSILLSIIRMAQNFVGKNNINLLYPSGMYGTREAGGSDHADPRYLKTFLSPIYKHIFLKDDELILTYMKDDNGQFIEPKWYLPIIPMILVNGCNAIAAGWRSKLPNFEPKQIIANLKRLLEGKKDLEAMQPWYDGFKGDILPRDGTPNSFIVKGKVEEKVGETNTVKIKELPIGKWTSQYKKVLDSHEFIERHDSHNDADEINFEVVIPAMNQVHETERHKWLLKTLKLTAILSASGLYLLDADGVLQHYDSVDHVLREFYDFRLKHYDIRKKAMLVEFEKELEHLKTHSKLRSSTESTDKLSAADLEAETKNIKAASKKLTTTSVERLWHDDLVALETKLDELKNERQIKRRRVV